MKYFRFSFVPEEMVISLSAVTYFNYNKEIQVFSEKDYEELKESDKMFARKFASDISETLMNKLDKEHGVI